MCHFISFFTENNYLMLWVSFFHRYGLQGVGCSHEPEPSTSRYVLHPTQYPTTLIFSLSFHIVSFFLPSFFLLFFSFSFSLNLLPEGAYKIEVDLGECKNTIGNGTVDTQLFLPANSTKAVNERKIDYCSVRLNEFLF